MLRIAIIGCGRIADQHVQAIGRISNCKIVALCDSEILMASQLGERFHIKQCFSDLGEMLEKTVPDVVHITTPPQSHFPLAKHCLEFGSHVYLEKPFAVTEEEAKALILIAEKRNLKITAGNNYQFTLEMQKLRRLMSLKLLGDKPIHMESYWTYNLQDPIYAQAVLHDPNHWVRRLPGQLFHNIISHGIAKLVEFLDDELVEVIASAHQSPLLQSSPHGGLRDELRVLIRDSTGTTSFFCFSSQIKPNLNQFRIYGEKGSALVDQTSGTLLYYTNASFKSYLTYFIPPIRNALQYARAACENIRSFATQRLYQDHGMRELIERFYDSVRNNKPPPIPYREIVLVARIMDEIFCQINRDCTNMLV
jgi:predicted dehydrogenase